MCLWEKICPSIHFLRSTEVLTKWFLVLPSIFLSRWVPKQTQSLLIDWKQCSQRSLWQLKSPLEEVDLRWLRNLWLQYLRLSYLDPTPTRPTPLPTATGPRKKLSFSLPVPDAFSARRNPRLVRNKYMVPLQVLKMLGGLLCRSYNIVFHFRSLKTKPNIYL